MIIALKKTFLVFLGRSNFLYIFERRENVANNLCVVNESKIKPETFA